MDKVVADPKKFYQDMIAMTSACMNRLLHVPVHYECVRQKRHPAMASLLVSMASARSRLEIVVSPDLYVYNALDKWKMMVDCIDTIDQESWD